MTSEEESVIEYCTCEKQITRAKTAASNNICDECDKRQIYDTQALDKILKNKKDNSGGSKEKEYLEAIDNLPGQFGQLNIDTGNPEPIYQKIAKESVSEETQVVKRC